MALPARRGIDTLVVQPLVDRVGARRPEAELAPELEQAAIVVAAAERARPVPGGEGSGLVEEEQLGEAAGPQQRAAQATEREHARDPALAVIGAADPPIGVMEAAAVAVREAAGRVGDQLAERSHPVLQRPRQKRSPAFALSRGRHLGRSYAANASTCVK